MISMLTSAIGQRGVDAVALLLAFALTALMDSLFRDKLPLGPWPCVCSGWRLSKGQSPWLRLDLCAVHCAGQPLRLCRSAPSI